MKISCQIKGSTYRRNFGKRAGLKYGRRLLLSPYIIINQNGSICSNSVDPSLTHFLGEFPGLVLALEPDIVVPAAEQGCAWSRNLDPNFCPGGDLLGPWNLAAANITTRLLRTHSF